MASKNWLVSRWMSKKPHVVAPDDRIVDALEAMRNHRIRHIPVVANGRLVGIVSDRDMRTYYPSRAHLEGGSSAYSKTLLQTPIKNIMTPKPKTIPGSATLREAAELLCREKVGALLVADDDKLEGILSAEDVLWAFADNVQNMRDAWEL